MAKCNNKNNLANLPQNRLTGAEKTAYYSKLGKRSAEVDRERKSFRQTCELLASTVIKNPQEIVSDYILRVAEDRGIDNLTYRDACAISLTLKAMNGDTKAFETLRDTLGEQPTADKPEEATLQEGLAFADWTLKTVREVLQKKYGLEATQEVMTELKQRYIEKRQAEGVSI